MDFDDLPDVPDEATFDLANWQRQLIEDTGPFQNVCFNLANGCGAIPLSSFLSNEYRDIDLGYRHLPLEADGLEENGEETTAKGEKTDGEPLYDVQPRSDFESLGVTPAASLPSLTPSQALPPQEPLDLLYQTCLRLTGTDQALGFEIVEAQPKCFECILTVSSLKGTKRAYKSGDGKSSVDEAKQEAARVAVEMGVVDFIRTGDSDVQKHKKAELIARAKIESKIQEASKPLHPVVLQIEECCQEWRAGKVVPNWAYYRQSAQATEWGASLRIALSLHQDKCYSTDPKYESKEEARVACAELALEDGILEYIKYGNGQTSPAPRDDVPAEEAEDLVRAQRLSLQEYFEGLPRPFPIDIGDTMNVSDLHPISRVNTMIQMSKVPALRINYYATNSQGMGIGPGGLSGCVLRLELPDRKAKTYIVDTHFAKRQDARAAVCLLAMSQDIDAYIQNLRVELESKLSPEHRLAAQNIILPALRRITRLKYQTKPKFEFLLSEEGHGCALAVDLDTEGKVSHKYISKPEYSTKLDGTLAVVCLAAEEGIFEILRYGTPLPPEPERKFWDIVMDPNLNEEEKNKLIMDQYEEKKDKRRRRDDRREDPPEEDDAVMGEIAQLISESKRENDRFKPGNFKPFRRGKPPPRRPYPPSRDSREWRHDRDRDYRGYSPPPPRQYRDTKYDYPYSQTSPPSPDSSYRRFPLPPRFPRADPRYEYDRRQRYPYLPPPLPPPPPLSRDNSYFDHDRVDTDMFMDPRNPYPHSINPAPGYENRPPPLPYDDP